MWIHNFFIRIRIKKNEAETLVFRPQKLGEPSLFDNVIYANYLGWETETWERMRSRVTAETKLYGHISTLERVFYTL